MVSRRFLVCAGLAAALSAVATDAPMLRARAQTVALGSLRLLFAAPGVMVRDTNGDGLADAVAARVVVPAKPTADDVEAAVNIGARLGFETTALTLPIVVREDEISAPAAIECPVLVGRDNGFVKTLAAAGSLDLKTLAPGQGLIAIVRSPLGGADGIVVVGGDDAGTLAAGLELAARLPRLWNMSGITIAGIEQQALQFLTGQRVGAGAASAVAVVVDAEKRGIATVTVRVEVPPSDAARALAALADLDAAHRKGQQPRVLNFAEVAATVVEVVAGGRTSGRAVVRRAGLNGRTLTPPIDPDELLPEPTGERGGAPAPPPSAPAKPFDLGSVYSIDGWLGDNYADLIADRTETSLIIGEPREALGAAAIATRLGLESTGVTFPLTKRDDKVRDPATEPSPILIGRTNALVQQLVKIGRARVDDLQAGDGAVQIVPRAFGNATATVVAGGDTVGADAASAYLSRRVPYVWDVARGAFTLDDVSTEVSRFLSARSGAGQAGQVVQELDTILKELKGKTIESFDAKLFLEKGDPALDKYLAEQVQRTLKDSKVTVVSQGVTDAVTVFEDKLDLPWEVDEFWAKFRSDVLPKVSAGSRVDLEARLSESPEIRGEIAEKVKVDLAQAGAANANVRVRSAYKQGFFWLTEQVMPDLKAKRASAVRIKVLAHKPDLSKKYKFYTVPSRWLHELFPADEIFQRDLGIPAASFTMELVDEARETYTLEALGPGGRVVYSAAFSPKFVEREYLDKFPGWSKVDVTTGWLTASIDGKTVADLRIQTDPERFWDHYQAKVLPKVYDNVMKVTGGKPTADKQPFHRDLDVEVWMSEPDFRLGIDEEQISALEALHEDLYFVTLDFFNAMGRTLVRQRLSAPGKVLPIIHPNRPGKPGQARILYAGNASTKAKLEVSYKEKGTEKPAQVSRDLSRIDATAPTVVRAIVRADRVSELELLVEAANDKEAARAADALDGLARLQASGLYRPSLSFDHVDRITVTIGLKEVRTRRTIRNTGATLPSKIRVAKQRPTSPVVAWDHVIGPDEAEQIVAKLSAFPEVRAYKVGESYRGRDLSVLEVTVPTVSELVSVTKLSAYKPTIFMMGRQHANEVSSTSHLLRFAELLATDPAYREILKKVNVILCPVMNPDGAQMAFELQKLTPTYMLHAGRYSALGMDVTSRTGNLLPEAEVEGRIWREWLPDIYLNPHGYPSHEWVQPFSGYVAPGFRAYWTSRGWYTLMSSLRDPRYPEHLRAALALREAVVREINSNADVRAMNLRTQARYTKWAYGFGPHLFNLEVYKDTTIFFTDPETGEPRGGRRASPPQAGSGAGRATMSAWPHVTLVGGTTEAPDETAQGAWLNLVTRAGFSFLVAHVNYLRNGQFTIERIEESAQRDGATLTTLRVRPVLPPRAEAAARMP